MKPGWFFWQHSFVIQDTLILRWNCIPPSLLELWSLHTYIGRQVAGNPVFIVFLSLLTSFLLFQEVTLEINIIEILYSENPSEIDSKKARMVLLKDLPNADILFPQRILAQHISIKVARHRWSHTKAFSEQLCQLRFSCILGDVCTHTPPAVTKNR